MALSNPNTLDPLVEKIHELRCDKEVRWFWVTAHVSVTGKKAANRLPKAGAVIADINVCVLLQPHSLKNRLSQEILKLW